MKPTKPVLVTKFLITLHFVVAVLLPVSASADAYMFGDIGKGTTDAAEAVQGSKSVFGIGFGSKFDSNFAIEGGIASLGSRQYAGSTTATNTTVTTITTTTTDLLGGSTSSTTTSSNTTTAPTNITIKGASVRVLYFDLVGIMPIDQLADVEIPLEFNAKIGIAFTQVKGSLSGSSSATTSTSSVVSGLTTTTTSSVSTVTTNNSSVDATKLGATYGVGAQYNISDDTAITVQWTRFTIGNIQAGSIAYP